MLGAVRCCSVVSYWPKTNDVINVFRSLPTLWTTLQTNNQKVNVAKENECTTIELWSVCFRKRNWFLNLNWFLKVWIKAELKRWSLNAFGKLIFHRSWYRFGSHFHTIGCASRSYELHTLIALRKRLRKVLRVPKSSSSEKREASSQKYSAKSSFFFSIEPSRSSSSPQWSKQPLRDKGNNFGTVNYNP